MRSLKALLRMVVRHFFEHGQVWGYMRELSQSKFDIDVSLSRSGSGSGSGSGSALTPGPPQLRRTPSSTSTTSTTSASQGTGTRPMPASPARTSPSTTGTASRRRSVSLSELQAASAGSTSAFSAAPSKPMPAVPARTASPAVTSTTTTTAPSADAQQPQPLQHQKSSGVVGAVKDVVSMPSQVLYKARDMGAPTPKELTAKAKHVGEGVSMSDISKRAKDLKTAAGEGSSTELVDKGVELGTAVGLKAVGVGAELGSEVASALRGKGTTDQIELPSLVAVALWEPEKFHRIKEVECIGATDKASMVVQHGACRQLAHSHRRACLPTACLRVGACFSRMLETFSFLDNARKKGLQKVKTAKGKHPAYVAQCSRVLCVVLSCALCLARAPSHARTPEPNRVLHWFAEDPSIRGFGIGAQMIMALTAYHQQPTYFHMAGAYDLISELLESNCYHEFDSIRLPGQKKKAPDRLRCFATNSALHKKMLKKKQQEERKAQAAAAAAANGGK